MWSKRANFALISNYHLLSVQSNDYSYLLSSSNFTLSSSVFRGQTVMHRMRVVLSSVEQG
jgi:hypothetical protein